MGAVPDTGYTSVGTVPFAAYVGKQAFICQSVVCVPWCHTCVDLCHCLDQQNEVVTLTPKVPQLWNLSPVSSSLRTLT